MNQLLFTIGFLLLASGFSLAQQSVPNFKKSKKSLFKIKKDQEYTFGYLEVAENRSKPNGKTIKLPIYIFKSRSKSPKQDPVIFLTGGPGVTAMSNAPYMKYWKYLDDRDLILFEQRGTTYAEPNLACPEWTEAVRMANLSSGEQEGLSLKLKAIEQCKERFEKQNIDLNAYTTKAIAQDVEDLKKVLGIEKYNLVTLSYGTKIAQTLMRDYPASIRSVVLDSPLPLEVSWDIENIQNLLDTYDIIFADCQSSPDCNKQFPDLKNRFYEFLGNCTTNPLEVLVTNPQTGKEKQFFLKGKDLVNLLGYFTTSEMAEVPYIINEIIEGDLSILQNQLQQFFEPASNGNGKGMRIAIWCAEETSFIDKEILTEEKNKFPKLKGVSLELFEIEVCNTLGVAKVDELENQAIKSDIPTLIINGEYDITTPIKWAKQLHKNLENSHLLILEGYGHTPTTYWSNPCAMQAANAFLNNPNQKPDLDCLKKIKTPEFRVE